MTALLSIKPHLRRKPINHCEEARKAKTAQLRNEWMQIQMMRELAETVREALEQEGNG